MPRRLPEERTFTCPECNSQFSRFSFRNPSNIRCSRCGHRGVLQTGVSTYMETGIVHAQEPEPRTRPEAICILCTHVQIVGIEFICLYGHNVRTPDAYLYNLVAEKAELNSCNSYNYEISPLRRADTWARYLQYQQAKIEAKLQIPEVRVIPGAHRTIRA